MSILQYLCPECIETQLQASDKKEVVARLAEMAGRVASSLDTDKVAKVLLEREALGTTGIGGGVAIPHGKIGDIDRLHLFFCRSKEGVPFDAIDHRPVKVIFLLLAPEDHATLYLRVLAKVSKLLKVERAVERLCEAEDWESLSSAIKALEAMM